MEEKIRRRAYEIFEERGGGHGRAVEDWIRAEREILGKSDLRSAPGGRSGGPEVRR